MPPHSEKPQTPARLTALAEAFRDIAGTLERAGESMKSLEIDAMPLPRANAEGVGLTNSRSFADAARDVIQKVSIEIAGGMEKNKAIEKILSGYRVGPRKQREKKAAKSKRKSKSDSKEDDPSPLSKAS